CLTWLEIILDLAQRRSFIVILVVSFLLLWNNGALVGVKEVYKNETNFQTVIGNHHALKHPLCLRLNVY
uniref:Uncharacterized protein n=1 Tax=Poecilia formosa TaxID=48698 RepID=A0A096LWR5_POEFO